MAKIDEMLAEKIDGSCGEKIAVTMKDGRLRLGISKGCAEEEYNDEGDEDWMLTLLTDEKGEWEYSLIPLRDIQDVKICRCSGEAAAIKESTEDGVMTLDLFLRLFQALLTMVRPGDVVAEACVKTILDQFQALSIVSGEADDITLWKMDDAIDKIYDIIARKECFAGIRGDEAGNLLRRIELSGILRDSFAG